jgi:subtilisin family serine protease
MQGPQLRKRALAALAATLFVGLLVRPAVRAASSDAPGPGPRAWSAAAVQPAVTAAVRAHGRTDVLVLLRDGAVDGAPVEGLTTTAARAREAALRELAGTGFRSRVQYDALPILAGSVDASALEALRRSPLVVAVEADAVLRPLGDFPPPDGGRLAPAMAEAGPLVGVDYVHNVLGVRGQGVTVAVLDTGVDNSHPDLAGRIVEQYCYSSSRSCAPTDKVESDNAQDEMGHGTTGSGIVLGSGGVAPVGMAPEANLVAVRVFQDAGGAQTADIIKGLDFVLTKAGPLGIRVVNMSLGGGSGRGQNCDDQNQAMKAAFQRLVARGVAIFVASGNDGLTSEVASPACISNSIAVGATYDGNYAQGACDWQKNVTPLTIACFTNRGRAMDILAPGIWISSCKLGGGVIKPGAGTSYASPMAAGLAALLVQANPDLRVSELETLIKKTGVTVQHLENNDTFPLVDAKAAVLSALKVTPPTPVATNTRQSTATPTRATPRPSATGPTTPPASPTPVPSATLTQGPTAQPSAAASPPPKPSSTSDEAGRLFLPALRKRAAGD